MSASVTTEIEQRLAVLAPHAMEIADESERHAGHAGAASGGHYRLRIVAPCFAGQLPLARHRAVYAALGDLMQTRIHALTITAHAPGEL